MNTIQSTVGSIILFTFIHPQNRSLIYHTSAQHRQTWNEVKDFFPRAAIPKFEDLCSQKQRIDKNGLVQQF